MGSLGSAEILCKTPKRTPIRQVHPLSSSTRPRSNSYAGSARRKTPTGRSSPGRFIPRRYSLDTDVANFKLYSPYVANEDWSNEVFEEAMNWGSSSVRQHRQRLARLSLGASERRILSFGSDLREHEETPNRPCSDTGASKNVGLTFKLSDRKLPKHPLRVLDLPNLADDFFTHTICWSADGHLVAALGGRLYTCGLEKEGTTCLEDIDPDCKEKRYYTAVACNSFGTLLAAGTNDSEIQIWDLKSLKLQKRFNAEHAHDTATESYVVSKSECRIIALDWKPCVDVLAVGCGYGRTELLDFRCKRSVLTIDKGSEISCVSAVKFSPNGALVAVANSRHELNVWDITNPQKAVFHRDAHTSAIRALSWYPSKNSVLASGGGVDDGFIRVWNVLNGVKLDEVKLKAQVCNVLFSPDTKELFSSQSKVEKHSVVVWEYPGLKKMGSLSGHTGRVLHMDLSPCKTRLATAAADETLRIWHIGKNSSVRFSSSSKELSFLGFR